MTVKEAVDLFSHEMINEIYHSILPSTLLTFFGFQPGVYSSRIFNLIGWILTYLLGLYQNEIKLFISSLLKLT